MKSIVMIGLTRKTYDIILMLRNNYSIKIVPKSEWDKLLIFFLRKVQCITLRGIDSDKFLILPTEIEDYSFIQKYFPQLVNKYFPDQEIVKQLDDKEMFHDLMVKLNIRTPKIFSLQEAKEFKMPLIIKPKRSKGAKGIYRTQYPHIFNHKQDEYIIQECLPNGKKINGFFCFCNQGDIEYWYTHSRISTWPKSGGVSVLCDSERDTELFRISSSIVKSLELSGFIMFEYLKVESHYYIIECNPRLWGSIKVSCCLSGEKAKNIIELSLEEEREYTYTKCSLWWPIPYGIASLKQVLNRMFSRKIFFVNLNKHNLLFMILLYLKIKFIRDENWV